MVTSSRLVGIEGKYDGRGGFILSRVIEGSPAAQTGLSEGDRIVSLNDRAVEDWFRSFRDDRASYLRAQSRLISGKLRYEVQPTRQLTVTPRPLALGEFLKIYAVRLIVAVSFALPVLYVAFSSTRERAAHLIALCCAAACVWVLTDRPLWPIFFSPMLFDISTIASVVTALVDVVALTLTLSGMLHAVLLFLERWPTLDRRWRLLPLNYLVPAGILTAVAATSGGDLYEHIVAVYRHRLWLHSVQLVILTTLIATSFRTTRSPAQRERTRWIIGATAAVVLSHLLLWNLPRLILGEPLVANYDLLLLPIVMIPLTLMQSISTHRLFGIRGLLRRRLRLLQSQLERERNHTILRERRIHELTSELVLLRREIEEYTRTESPPPTEANGALRRLEEQYPEITALRDSGFVSASPRWVGIFAEVAVAARGGAPVLIVGESGTGKTDIARLVQQMGDRRDAVYREISCGQFEHADPAIALSRLFGIGRGHGLPNLPRDGQRGLLEECDRGTLFLDDFDRLPLNVQDALLYPLEGKSFDPGIGKGTMVHVSIKFIFATNRVPEELVSERGLRRDVLARFGPRVVLPPLRERPEDIPPLVEHFIRLVSAEIQHEVTLVSPKALALLAGYPYRLGNARELKAEIYRAVGNAMLERDPVLRAGYLSEALLKGATSVEPLGLNVDTTPSLPLQSSLPVPSVVDESVAINVELAVLRRHRFAIQPSETELGFSHKSRTLSHYLRGICLQALVDHAWCIDDAARAVAGSNDARLHALLSGKMRRYLDNIRGNIAARTEDKLYQNLPISYHRALEQAIQHMRI